MANMTLRGINEHTARALEERARQEGASVNAGTLRLLRGSLRLEKRKRCATYSDLDHLAGTRSLKNEFKRNRAVFEQIDEELWKLKSALVGVSPCDLPGSPINLRGQPVDIGQ